MLNNEIIKQATTELEAASTANVVKVASIVGRLRAWYNSLFDPEYRSRVNSLKQNSMEFKQDMFELMKYINEVDEAIKSGDVDRYEISLEELKRATKSLNQSLSQLHNSAEEAKPPEVQSLDDSKPKVIFRESTLNNPKIKPYFIKLLKDEGIDEDVIEQIMQDSQFLRDVESAIENGTVVGSKAVTVGGKNDKRVGELYITYETKPFNLTNFPIAMQIRAIVTDISKREHEPKPQMTVMRFEKVRVKKLTTANFDTFMTKIALDEQYKQYEGTQWEWAFDTSQIKGMRAKYNWSNFVPDVKTEISKENFVSAVKNIWSDIFPDIQMTEAGIGLLWAQAALETGNFKSMHNYNLGNIKATPQWSQDNTWTAFACGETIQGKTVRFTEHHPACFWRAHETLEDGMKDYLSLLGNERYKAALIKATQGDPKGFIYGLKEKGYFTADPAKYLAETSRLYTIFQNNQPKEDSSPPPPASSLFPKDTRQTKVQPKQPTESDMDSDLKSEISKAPLDVQKQVGELMSYLKQITASPLTSMVKQSIADLVLPRSEFTIVIKTLDNNKTTMVEYASILSNALQSAIGADTDIHLDGGKVEVSCSVAGSMDTATKAASAVEGVVSKAFANKYKTLVYGSVYPSLCKIAALGEFEVDRQKRKFSLIRSGAKHEQKTS